MQEIQKAIPIKDQPKIKKYLPAIILIPSFYYSFSFTSGVLIGYFLSKFFYSFFVERGKVGLVFIDWGNWKFHFHHWMLGVIILAIVWVIDFFYLPTFFAGVVCGMIVHDIYDFNDWHQILSRKPVSNK